MNKILSPEERNEKLYEYALAVEKDQALHNEMKEWDVTSQDGLEELLAGIPKEKLKLTAEDKAWLENPPVGKEI